MLEIIRLIELNVGVEVKPKRFLLECNFRRKWFMDGDYMKFWIFRKKYVKTWATANFQLLG